MHSMFLKLASPPKRTKQIEQLNFQKVSAILADYGFQTIRLSNDWKGADFIAQHIGGIFLLVHSVHIILNINQWRDNVLTRTSFDCQCQFGSCFTSYTSKSCSGMILRFNDYGWKSGTPIE